MDRQSIIGFTEAELGLFAAILFFILTLAGDPNDVETSQVPQLTDKISLDSVKIAQLERELEEQRSSRSRQIPMLEKQVAQLTDKISLDSVKIAQLERELEEQRSLRSRQIPTCKERNVAKGSIRDVTIWGPNSFQVGFLTYDLRGFLETVKAERLEAEKAQCRHVIRVFYSSALLAPESLAARKTLAQYFYLQE